CPYCGFENMLISSNGSTYFDVICPICGYARWTEEKIPKTVNIELATRILRKMSTEEKENVIESYYEENIPLIARLKDKSPNQD
ncbi:MAG: hypothetical protein ACE5NG_07000, partial [bacterium]